jgi:hypothetical protein
MSQKRYEIYYCNGTRYFLTDWQRLLKDIKEGKARVYRNGKLLVIEEVKKIKKSLCP